MKKSNLTYIWPGPTTISSREYQVGDIECQRCIGFWNIADGCLWQCFWHCLRTALAHPPPPVRRPARWLQNRRAVLPRAAVAELRMPGEPALASRVSSRSQSAQPRPSHRLAPSSGWHQRAIPTLRIQLRLAAITKLHWTAPANAHRGGRCSPFFASGDPELISALPLRA